MNAIKGAAPKILRHLEEEWKKASLITDLVELTVEAFVLSGNMAHFLTYKVLFFVCMNKKPIFVCFHGFWKLFLTVQFSSNLFTRFLF